MTWSFKIFGIALIVFLLFSLHEKSTDSEKKLTQEKPVLTAKDILGNPEYQAISYGGYRYIDHAIYKNIWWQRG